MHRTLAHIKDEDERFTAIQQPPPHPRTGVRMWTLDQANRRVTRLSRQRRREHAPGQDFSSCR
ncbi:DUF6192 family protein [Streptomyces sp. NPDC059639]|uniref:DUF6192 family protein n=1 Tax=Streptomyces sp. NPDC059639 TaxID=3346891 RepID=UPI0036BF9CDF